MYMRDYPPLFPTPPVKVPISPALGSGFPLTFPCNAVLETCIKKKEMITTCENFHPGRIVT